MTASSAVVCVRPPRRAQCAMRAHLAERRAQLAGQLGAARRGEVGLRDLGRHRAQHRDRDRGRAGRRERAATAARARLGGEGGLAERERLADEEHAATVTP